MKNKIYIFLLFLISFYPIWAQTSITGQNPGQDFSLKSKSTNAVIKPTLRLKISNGTNSDETVVYSNPSASNGYEVYDSPKYFNVSAAMPEIYTIAGSEQLAINGLNSITADTEYPLGVLIVNASVTTYSITATQFINFPPGAKILLKDKLNPNNPVTTDLTSGISYSFSSGALNYNTTRFALVFQSLNPAITSTGILSAVNTTYGTVSATTKFAIFGVFLTNNITITAPTGFHISKTSGGKTGFASSQILTQSVGLVDQTTIYVRLDSTNTTGTFSGYITCVSAGATTVNLATVSSTVSPKSLSITGLTGVTKVYDGTNSATFSGTASYSGFVNGENFPVSGTPVATFANGLVGTGKIITVNGYTPPTSNYTVVSPTLIANISPISLIITGLTGENKQYDGNNSASFTGTASYSGFVNAENFVISGTPVATFANGLVGTGKIITVNGYTPPTSNYTVVSPTLTADITPKALSINGLTCENKQYDGNNLAAFTGTPTYSGLVNDESFEVSGTPVATFENTLVGTGKIITVNGYTPPTSNYTVVSPTLTADIIPKALSINGLTGENKQYDGNNSASFTGTASYSGFVNDESFEVTGTPVATFENASVANGKIITVNGFNSPTTNYTVIAPNLTADITPINAIVSSSGSIGSSDLLPGTDLTVLPAVRLNIDRNSTVHSITVNPGGEMTLEQDIILNTGALTLQSDATGSATFVDNGGILNATTTNVQQYMTAGRNWYISSPVAGGLSSTFNAVNNANTVCWYDEIHGNSTPWQYITDNISTLDVMKGYVISMAASGPVTFIGTINTGTQSINLSRTPGQNKEGFNLVGNPYPSYLDWNQISKNKILSTIWYRTKTQGGAYTFDTYNATGGMAIANGTKPVSNLIPPMQAFWVRVEPGETQATLSVDNTNCTHRDNVNNGFKSKASVNTTQPVLRLQISNGINSDETIIYSNTEASNDYDGYDSPKMFDDSAELAEIFTVTGSENVAINGLNTIPYDTEIPIGYSTLTSGSFSLKASQISNFVEGTQIILKDYLDINNPVIVSLNDSSYSFISDSTSFNVSRFTLLFHEKSVTTGSNVAGKGNVWISNNSNGQLIIHVAENGETSVQVYNAIGQRVVSKNLKSNNCVLDNHFIPGIYTIVLTNSGKYTSAKLIIK